MVGDASWAKESLISALARLALGGGILSTFAGLPAMLLKQIPYTMGKQVSFDILAEFFYGLVALQQRFTAAELKWTISILSAFWASIIACLMSQPGDVLLTETYRTIEGAGHGKGQQQGQRSVGDIIKAIVADAIGTPLDLFQRISIDPASITVIHYGAERPRVLSLNEAATGPAGRLLPKKRSLSLFARLRGKD
jgi:hypothetical protein